VAHVFLNTAYITAVDRIIKKNKWSPKRIITVGGIIGIVLLIAGSIYFTSGKSKLNVETGRITISEVKKGPFQEFIPVNGVVMPLTTIYLDAIEGGRVEEKYAEDGAMLKKGDPILKLANTDLELSLANQQTAVFNVLTQMQISRDQAQQNTTGKLQTMADVDNALREATRIYNLDKTLYAGKAVSTQEYQAAVNAYEYAIRRKNLNTQILKQDSVTAKQQVAQSKESYVNMKNTLELMKKKVGDLVVRAPIDGQLTGMDAEIGQNKNVGEHLGQIDVLSGFKIRAGVDEHYISRIFTGLTAYYATDDQSYKLVIKKVFTQVVNGLFNVDMEFIGGMPKGLRKGQTLQIRLAFSDEVPALLLPKGGFYQQTGGNWIFKLSEDGKTAYRVDIQLNRQSPDYYEITRGLKPGDKVITSGYETYGDVQELVLK